MELKRGWDKYKGQAYVLLIAPYGIETFLLEMDRVYALTTNRTLWN